MIIATHKVLMGAARQERIALKWTFGKQMEIAPFRPLGTLGSTKQGIVTEMVVQSKQT